MDNGAAEYEIHGLRFMTTLTARETFAVFDERRECATDRCPTGMVEELRAFARLTEGRKSLLDVGALFGLFSLVFTARPLAKAFALEPSPWAYPVLAEQVALNPDRRIAAFQAFAGERTGERVACGRDWCHVVANVPGTEPHEVTTVTVDDVLDGQAVDTMKIDVEGYECQVLRGARATLCHHRPLIFLECHIPSLPRYGESAESLEALIRGMDYELTDYAGEPVTLRGKTLTRILCQPR